MTNQALFRAIKRTDGYLPIEDFGLIGDGSTAALVGRDGCVAWMCVPRFDSEPLFCSLLDKERGGCFSLTPDRLVEGRHRYEPDTGVLITELRSETGVMRVTDCLTLRAGSDLNEDVPAARGELLRCVEVIDGEVDLVVEIAPRGGATADPTANALAIRTHRTDLDLRLVASVQLKGLRDRIHLGKGERADFSLRWGAGGGHRRPTRDPAEIVSATADAWRRWSRCISYEGPHEEAVKRSAITLKMLDYLGSGAIMAAPTSSLPELIGGVRNWDYRFAWVRDAAFSVYAMRRVGLDAEAWGFLGWVLDALERDGRPRVLYTIDALAPPPERTDPDLEGYRGSAPVRWGNGAAEQRQHDAYGEIVDAAYQWAAREGSLHGIWPRIVALIEEARRLWDQPDQGIWEVRTTGRVFTYSAAMCHVALDRGARLAQRFELNGDVAGWRREADKITAAILDQSWDPDRRSLTENLGGGGLDSSLLALPLRRVIPARHPKMVSTVQAVNEELGAGDGLLYRYLPRESPDGLPGHEGAFLLCSFWLVDNLAHQGRVDEALELYDSLCERRSAVGLLPEEIDPTTGAFLGNFPQAFSHVGLISSGITLTRRLKERSS